MKTLEMAEVHKERGSGARSSKVLKGISLAVDRGEIVLLEGPSGSGKTTLLSVASGLLLPDRGEVRISGMLTSGLPQSERRSLRLRQVGFVFQQANLLARLTVCQNIMLIASLAGMDAKTARRETRALLELLRLDGRADHYPSELSGGEEQRAAVARALVHGPRLVLADEPTGNLDRASGLAVVEALVSTAAARNAAVVIATHDLRLKTAATRLISIDDGAISERTSV